MNTLRTLMKAFWQEESGLTVVEYAVAGSLVTLGVTAAFTGLGNAVASQIITITTRI